MHRYTFYCKKCGHHLECATKQDWLIEKQDHKKRGCQLMLAPHKNMLIMARAELAGEATKGKEIMERDAELQAHVLSLKVEDEDDTADEHVPGVATSDTGTEGCEGPV